MSLSTSFAQQGSLDWVALSQTSFTAPVAVLGRLSGAGIEPLTVAVSQAMGSMLTISMAGEQKLRQAMASCGAFGSYGDVVWFGIGVRHVLQTLVQSSQGASSVSLAACLTEGFSPQYSAVVLYEVAKMMKAPAELTPSYTQWLRYVETCSGILATTTFGKQIDQLAKLSGYTTSLSTLDDPRNRVVQAKELAEFFAAIRSVQSGQLDTIEVLSGPVSSWAVAFCDSFLSLRVVLYSHESTILFQNYNASAEHPQVIFRNASVYNRESALTLRGRVFSLNSGEFLEKWHLPEGHATQASSLLNSRVDWKNILRDCYGAGFLGTSEQPPTRFTPAKAFSNLLAASVLMHHGSVDSQYYRSFRSAVQIVTRFSAVASDLDYLVPDAKTTIVDIEEKFGRPLHVRQYHREEIISGATQHEIAMKKERDGAIWSLYTTSVAAIQECCSCAHHPFRCDNVVTMFTMIVIANLFANVILDDGEELQLSRAGLRALHEEIFDRSYPMNSADQLRACLLTGMATSKEVHILNYATMFETYLHLFSGYRSSLLLSVKTRPKISAMSSGGFYCYVDFLRDPFQSEIECSRVHIGRGSIQADGRNFPWIHDQEVERLPTFESKFRKVSVPTARAMVEDNVTLRFWYEQWDSTAPAKKQNTNPMECLAIGWSGSDGLWSGYNTRLPRPPTTYTNGLNPVLNTDGDQNREVSVPENSSLPLKKSRICGHCRVSGHTARTCPERSRRGAKGTRR